MWSWELSLGWRVYQEGEWQGGERMDECVEQLLGQQLLLAQYWYPDLLGAIVQARVSNSVPYFRYTILGVRVNNCPQIIIIYFVP